MNCFRLTIHGYGPPYPYFRDKYGVFMGFLCHTARIAIHHEKTYGSFMGGVRLVYVCSKSSGTLLGNIQNSVPSPCLLPQNPFPTLLHTQILVDENYFGGSQPSLLRRALMEMLLHL